MMPMIQRVIRHACYEACRSTGQTCYCETQKPNQPACSEAQMAKGIASFVSNVPPDTLHHIDRLLRRIRKEFPE